MKLNNQIYLLVSALFAAGCSEQLRVKSDYDKDVDLKLYKTYAWLPVKEIESKVDPLFYNELYDKRIKSAVDIQLKSKSIHYTTDSPNLRIHYHILVNNKSIILPTRYGYNYSPYWIRNQTDVYYYQEGTLIIDFMDAKNNNLVWRGWATATVGNNEMDLTEEKINEAVHKILKKFPPVEH
jgi:Domain of unknown function (DUF4136)